MWLPPIGSPSPEVAQVRARPARDGRESKNGATMLITFDIIIFELASFKASYIRLRAQPTLPLATTYCKVSVLALCGLGLLENNQEWRYQTPKLESNINILC